MPKDYQKEQKLTFLNSSWTDKISKDEYEELLREAKDYLTFSLNDLYCKNGYKYVMNRFPTISDDKLPQDVKKALKQHNTFACASQDGVFFDTRAMVDTLLNFYDNDKVKEELGSDASIYSQVYCELRKVTTDVLKHEYGHIINGHVFLPCPTEKDKAQATVYTNEIETNRTIPLIDRSTYLKMTGITDDNEPFNCCKNCLTREGIYKKMLELVRQYNDKDSKEQQSEQGGGDKQNSQTNCDSEKDGGKQMSGQHGNEELPQVENDIYHGRDTIKSDDRQQAMDTLCREIGVQPTKEIVDSTDGQTVLEQLEIVTREKEIQKTLSHLKGCVKGNLCKDKVSTYSRQTRKHTEDGMLRKGVKNDKDKRPKILVALDASGSMDRVAVQTASNAIKMVIDTIGRNSSDISICTFNHQIIRKGKLANWQNIVNSYSSNGGTSFERVVELAMEQDADIVLCVGDGQDCICAHNIHEKNRTLPKWVDILITGNAGEIDTVKNYYYSNDEKSGVVQRETLWVGCDEKQIGKALGNI